MNKKLMLQLLVVLAFAGTQIEASVMGPREQPYYSSALNEAQKSLNLNMMGINPLIATITNGNVGQQLYIQLLGGNYAYPIGAMGTSIQVLTSLQYLIYPSAPLAAGAVCLYGNYSGAALLVTVFSPTSIGVQKCLVNNGNIGAFTMSPMVNWNCKNAIIYLCRNSKMDNGTMYTDSTLNTAFTAQMW